MADGVAITAGTGTNIATDDCGASGHAQVIKQAVSADGDATLVPASATDGLLVNLGANNDVTITSGTVTTVSTVTTVAAVTAITNALPAGTNAIGKLAANSGVDIGDVDVTSVGGQASSATVAQVASSASNVTLLASSSARKGCIVFNDSTAALYMKFGATASTSSFTVKIAAGGYWEMAFTPHGIYYGIIDGIWASANGNAYVTSW